MILRKTQIALLVVLLMTQLSFAEDPPSKTYDTSEWIPIAQPEAPVKKAQARVLNLSDPPPQKNFFPEQNTKPQQFQQYLRETTMVNPFAARVQHAQTIPAHVSVRDQPYRFEIAHRQNVAEDIQPQYYVQAQPIQQQFVMRQILQEPQVQFVVPQPQQQQIQQYHTIPQEYLNAPFVPQHYHQVPTYKIKLPANKTKTFIARPVVEPYKPKKEEKESVQLVYVPLESLKQRPQTVGVKPPQQLMVKNIETDFVKQALGAHKLQMQLQEQVPMTTRPSAAVKKRKPHQPPLAVYMGGDRGVGVSDVLALLKNAKSIDVQDSFGPHSPQVFVGPSSLSAPNGYAKFELPYLSNIDNNRVERKVDQLPFFVAPLSYKAPTGYSKIPLPSPHVGSVVVSTKANLLHEKVNNTASPVQYYQEKLTSTTSAPKFMLPHHYEIDQINNQFIPTVRYQFPVSKYQEYDVESKEEEYLSPPTTTTTQRQPKTTKYYTPSPIQNDDTYTVLEEYNGNSKSSTPNYHQYNSQEYFDTSSPEPIYLRSSTRPMVHPLNQDVIDYQVTEEPLKTRYKTVLVPVTSTERSQPRQTTKPLPRPQIQASNSNEDQSQSYRITEDVPQPNGKKQYLSEAFYNPEKYYNLPSLLPPVSESLPGLINELQDQSLKSLLVPALLAPTTSRNVKYGTEEYVEVSSNPPQVEVSTEASVQESTTRRNRGRQRGSRYTTASSVSSDTTRRTLPRGRRPYTSRPKEDVVSSTTEYSNVPLESRKTVPINRSRFRTRGRPTNNEDKSTVGIVEEAASSTLRGNSVNALASYQIDEISNTPSVKYEEQYIYQPVYNVKNDEATVVEVLRQTPQYDEVTEGKSVLRSRVRSRTRSTTTTTTTPPQTSKEEYGFIRIPSYKKFTDVSNDSRETQKYSSTYVSSTARPINQYAAEEVPTVRAKEIRYYIQEQLSPSSTPIYFIGEIRPKYQPNSSTSRIYDSTQDYYVATTSGDYITEPAVTTKVRNRLRIAGRLKDTNEELTTKPIRSRTRGKSHYKPPLSVVNKKTSEEEDVEGGNYPELYLKSKETYTPRPSFQITVDPSEDQVPHSSIYQPKYLPQSPVLNNIPEDLKSWNLDQFATEPTPTALPYVDVNTEKLTQDSLNVLEDVTTAQELIEDTTIHAEEVKKPFGKRRGVWKLVKARPVEVFEGAESQSLSSNKNKIELPMVLNTYQVTEEPELNTIPPESTIQTTSEESNAINTEESQKSDSLFDSLYEMFGITETQEQTNSTETDNEQTSTENINLNNVLITEMTTMPKDEEKPSSETTQITATEPQTTEEEIGNIVNYVTTHQPMSFVTPMSLHMWTSTSTEVSHETEICYKGKCVKSKE